MEKKSTYFCDIDGTIFKYRKFETYLETDVEVIETSKKFLEERKNDGHMIVLTTALPKTLRVHT